MSLVSLIRDGWNSCGTAAKVGLLTTGLLVGGFVSSLYAQEPLSGLKPKDTHPIPYVKVADDDKEEKKDSPASTPSRPRIPRRYSSNSSSSSSVELDDACADVKNRKKNLVGAYYASGKGKGWITNCAFTSSWDFLSDLNTSNSLKLSGAFIGSKTGYLRLETDISYDNMGQVCGGGISFDFAAVTDKKIMVNLGLQTSYAGGPGMHRFDADFNFGVRVKKEYFSLLLGTFIGFGNAGTKVPETWPYEREVSREESRVFSPASADGGLRLGSQSFNLEFLAGVRGHSNDATIEDYVYDPSGSPQLCDYEEESFVQDAHYQLSMNVNHKYLFFLKLGLAYSDILIKSSKTYLSGSTIFDKESSQTGKYLGNAFLNMIFPMQSGNLKEFNYFGGIYAMAGKNEQLWLGTFTLASKKNNLGVHLAMQRTETFTAETLIREWAIKRRMYDARGTTKFHYSLSVGARLRNPDPKKDYILTDPESVYLVLALNAIQKTSIGKLQFKASFEGDMANSQHPGMLDIELNLFNSFALSLGYSIQFSDIGRPIDGMHTFTASVGVNF